MDLKTTEMIALGVAYGINCQYCMQYHKNKATEAGLTKEEMLAAIGVAEAVKNGAYNKNKADAEKLFGVITAAGCCPDRG
jgi:AhpD family alkylhydroperoxidase